MKLNSLKELAHVPYSDSGIRILGNSQFFCEGKCFATHWHDRIELIRVKRGAFTLKLKNSEYVVEKDSVAIIMPREPHCGLIHKGGVCYDVLMFEPSAFFNATNATSKYLEPINRSTLPVKPVINETKLIKLFDNIINEHDKEETATGALNIVGYIYQLLGILHQNLSDEVRISDEIDERFSNVLDYINEHYTEKISTSQISAKFGYDEAYFCRRFIKVTGLTAMQYIKILRLEAAEMLLKMPGQTDTVSDVAFACGFSDVSYFTKCFRKRFSITPTEILKNKS